MYLGTTTVFKATSLGIMSLLLEQERYGLQVNGLLLFKAELAQLAQGHLLRVGLLDKECGATNAYFCISESR
jgi:hypothetical protein